jgi:putative phosphoesterase
VLVGVISDTHGYLDPRVASAFGAVDLILHAGDVGSLDVLDALRAIAPVVAVRGNNDDKLGGLGLPPTADVAAGGLAIHLVHRLPDAVPQRETRVVVFGHSHRALSRWSEGRLYLNPGAAGRVGFHTVQTAALMSLENGEVSYTFVELGPRVPTTWRK